MFARQRERMPEPKDQHGAADPLQSAKKGYGGTSKVQGGSLAYQPPSWLLGNGFDVVQGRQCVLHYSAMQGIFYFLTSFRERSLLSQMIAMVGSLSMPC